MTNDITITAQQVPTSNKALRQCLHNDMLAHRTETDLNDATAKINEILNYPIPNKKSVMDMLEYFYNQHEFYYGISAEIWIETVFRMLETDRISYAILCDIMNEMWEIDQLPNPKKIIRECILKKEKLERTAESIKDEQARRLREKDTEPGAYKKTTTRAEREEAIRLAKTIAGLIPDINQTS